MTAWFASKDGPLQIFACIVGFIAYVTTAMSIGDWGYAFRRARGRKPIPFLFLHALAAPLFLPGLVALFFREDDSLLEAVLGIFAMPFTFYIGFLIVGSFYVALRLLHDFVLYLLLKGLERGYILIKRIWSR